MTSSSRTTWGRAFAERVADHLATLEEPHGIAHIHRDYCGHGLFHSGGEYRLCEVYDGYPSGPANPNHPLRWDNREDFVAFLARQSDHSLSGFDPKAPGLFTRDNRLRNNQRLNYAWVAREVAAGEAERLLAHAPSPEAWSALMDAVCAWPHDDALSALVQPVLDRVASWPEALRVATRPLVALALTHPPDPRVALARVFVFEHLPNLNRKQLGAFIGALQLDGAGIAELRVHHIDLAPSLVRRLLGDGALPGLHTLSLRHTGLDDGAMRTFADADWAGSLVHLTLDHNAITDAGLETLCASRYLGPLQTLSLRHNPIGARGIRALLDAPLMDTLTHLHLPELDDAAASVLAASGRLGQLQALGVQRSDALGEEAALALLNAPGLMEPARKALANALGATL